MINIIYFNPVISEGMDVQPRTLVTKLESGYETLYSNDINQSYYVKQKINHIVSKFGKWYMFNNIYLSSLALRTYSIKFISIANSDFVTTVHRAAAVAAVVGANLKTLSVIYYCCWNHGHTKLNTLRLRRRYYNWKYSNTRNNTYSM